MTKSNEVVDKAVFDKIYKFFMMLLTNNLTLIEKEENLSFEYRGIEYHIEFPIPTDKNTRFSLCYFDYSNRIVCPTYVIVRGNIGTLNEKTKENLLMLIAYSELTNNIEINEGKISF